MLVANSDRPTANYKLEIRIKLTLSHNSVFLYNLFPYQKT